MIEEPAYAAQVMRWAERLHARGHEGPVFFHLGYFESPVAAPGEAELLAAQARLDARVVELAELGEHGRVLDVGCGLGGTLTALRQRAPGLRGVGLNASGMQLGFARRHDPQLELVRGDACALPFADCVFDHVVAIECAFHFGSRRAFLREAARVLRPGGTLALSDFELADGAVLDAEQERALVEGNAPWPDVGGRDGYCEPLALELGFERLARVDASPHVLPSFAGLIDRPVTASMGSVDRASAELGRLLRSGAMRMVFLSLRRT